MGGGEREEGGGEVEYVQSTSSLRLARVRREEEGGGKEATSRCLVTFTFSLQFIHGAGEAMLTMLEEDQVLVPSCPLPRPSPRLGWRGPRWSLFHSEILTSLTPSQFLGLTRWEWGHQ